MSILILSGDNSYPVIIGSEAVWPFHDRLSLSLLPGHQLWSRLCRKINSCASINENNTTDIN